MRLSSLSLQGFKSFADRVQLDFSDGINAIVGPNGSGKSNLIDAMRWVAGGGRASAYRAEEKTELIFHGASGKRSVNFTEVELQLKLGSNSLRIARSLYRDGQGRLTLNGKNARLSDVEVALSGSGLGRGGLAIIGQGEVGQVLVADPARLLSYVEEATGVAKLSGRREDTLARLQSASDHLERLDALLQELADRAEKLGNEAQQAHEAEQLTRRSLQLRYTLAWRRLQSLESDVASLEGEATNLAQALEQGEEALQALQASWQTLRQTVGAEEASYRQAMAELEARRGDVRVAEERHRSLLERLKVLARERGRLELDLERLSGLTPPVAPEVTLADLELAHQRAQAAQAKLETQVAMTREALRQRKTAYATARDSQQQHEQAALAYSTRLQQLKSLDADLGARLAALDGADGGEALKVLGAELSAASLDAESKQAHANKLKEALDSAQQEQASLLARTQAAQQNATRARAAFEARRGYAEGPRHALQSGIPGILGPVADLLSVPPKLQVATASALGRRAENIVVESADTGQRVLAHLKERGGRATVLPLDLISGREDDDRLLEGASGYRGLLSRLIHYDARYAPLVKQLLGSTGLVETLEQGVDIARRHRRRPRLVTLEGDLIEAYGALTGGKAATNQATVIGLRDEVEALALEASQAQARFEEMAAHVQGLQDDYRQALRAQTEARDALAQAGRKLAEARERQAGHAALSAELQAQAQQVKAQLEALVPPKNEASADLAGLSDELERLEREEALQAAQFKGASQTLAEAQEALAVGRERWRRFEDAHAAIKQAEAQRASLLERQAQLAQEDTKLRQATDGAAKEVEEAKAKVPTDLEAKRQAYEGLRQQATTLEASLSEASRVQADRSSKLEASRLSLARREASLELARDEVKGFPSGVVLAEGSSKAQRDELSAVQERLEHVGPVNHRASLELAELSSRLEEMQGQATEAKEAVAELEGVLGRIDSEVNARLGAAITQVRHKFILHARQLFGGGEADVVAEHVDGRPVGLKISLQPPGKATRSLNLLSVGERTMGALAFLFALMATGDDRGLSLAVLDEVDAPLDEANIRRFCSFLSSLASEKTQFVLITHQKATMEVADTLWGITTEQGVSRVFSISRSEREAAI